MSRRSNNLCDKRPKEPPTPIIIRDAQFPAGCGPDFAWLWKLPPSSLTPNEMPLIVNIDSSDAFRLLKVQRLPYEELLSKDTTSSK